MTPPRTSKPYTQALIEEILSTFGGHYEPMPPDVGKVIVPEVATSVRAFGEATLYNCLLSDYW